MGKSTWVRKNGQRPGRLVRDSMDTQFYGKSHSPRSRMRGPTQIIECACGRNTVARSPDAGTVAGWTVEWPAEPHELQHVRARCPRCGGNYER